MLEEKYLIKLNNEYFALHDEVLDDIRMKERERIVEFLRSDDWIYELAEDCADAIEELEHYDWIEVH